MSCPHDWQPIRGSVFLHVCTRCAATTYDPTPPVRITDNQTTALCLERDEATGLLQPIIDRYWPQMKDFRP